MSPAIKLSVYFGERDRVGRRPLTGALLELLARREIAVSLLLRGASGFGAHHHLRTDRLLTLSEDLPVVAVAVDAEARIRALLPGVAALAPAGLVTLERARFAAGGVEPSAGEGVRFTAFLAGAGLRGEAPAHRSVVAALQANGVDGATVLTGVDGTLHGRRRRARLFGRNAGVPEMVVAVGDGRAIAASLAAVERAAPGALTTLERVRVCKRDGVALARPHAPAEAAGMWCKLSVFASTAAGRRGRPLGDEAVLRLREAGAAGATLVRGTWGFHGDHAPHGDRVRGLRRHVPLVVVCVDAPERAARWFGILDALTGERGLVTSELVPARRVGAAGVELADLAPPAPR